MKTGIDLLREAGVTNVAELAHRMGLKRQTLYQWERVPERHILTIERLTGIPRHLIRPDLYETYTPPAPRETEEAA